MQKLTKPIVAIMLIVAICLTASCTKDNGGNGTYNGHDYIDLGLPSGTMWATCNVGAENPEGYGDYFAWGETQPKAAYSDSNYIYSNGSDTQLTKYCTKSEFGFNGFTDNLKTLQSSDDAATANWGEGWRTPTYNQWVELLSKCTPTKTTRNGVNGCLFTARNGNSIFLPAAGSYGDEELDHVGDNGSYWSSLINKAYPDGVKGFKFTLSWNDYDIYDLSREFGLSVRPVHASK